MLLVWATAGVLLGLIVNPYSPRSLTFAVEHALPKLVPAGDFVIGVGNEWYPYTPQALMRAAGASLAVAGAGLIPMVLSLRFRRRWDGRVVALALLAIFFTILLIRSRRFVEYQPAFALLFCAFAWSVEIPWAAIGRTSSVGRWLPLVGQVIPLVAALALLGPTIQSAQNSARTARPADVYAGAGRWLRENTPAGARVFTTDWDDFPVLFFHNVHNTYLIGLDPTYMYQYNPAIYSMWRSISRGQVKQPSAVIRDQFDSSYVLSDRDHASFYESAVEDPGLREVYRDGTSIIYEVMPAP
jgi:hypothetical protein